MTDQWAISVQFSPQLRTDGEFIRVTITQRRGEHSAEILLTEEQAHSLVLAINARFPSPNAARDERKNDG